MMLAIWVAYLNLRCQIIMQARCRSVATNVINKVMLLSLIHRLMNQKKSGALLEGAIAPLEIPKSGAPLLRFFQKPIL